MFSIKRLGRWAMMILAMTLFMCQSARADYLFNNLNQPAFERDSLSSDIFQAASFSTESATTLTNVNLLLGLNGKLATGSFTINLVADNSTSLGATLATLATVNDSELNPDIGVYSLSTSYSLNAQTRYWIVLRDTGNSSSYWGWTLSDAGHHVANEYFQNANSKGVQPNSEGPYIMQLVAAPEPASVALFGFAIPALLVVTKLNRAGSDE